MNSPKILFCIAMIMIVVCSSAPARSEVTISTDEIEADVSTDVPRILEYRLKSTGGRIAGSLGKGAPSVVITDQQGKQYTVEWEDLASETTVSNDSVIYSCTAEVDGQPVAKFDYSITAELNTVTLATENIRELNGYDILEFRLPSDPLVRVDDSMPSPRVCVGDLLGEKWRSGQPAEVGIIKKPGESLGDQYHFGLVYNDKAAAGIYSNSLYEVRDKPVHTVVGDNSTGLYTNHHRYSYKEENYEPYYCKIGIVGDRNRDDSIDWQDAACFIHDAIPKRVKLNQDCIKYMMNHGLHFADGPESVFRQICNMSDGQKQMVLLSGWNGWGWDSEYPTWNHPGEEYGGRAGLYYLHRNAHKYRAYSSMIHNFDDAYKRTRMWNPNIIAHNQDGSLVSATWWSGGPSYIISPYRFWKTGKAKETIDGLISQGLEKQIFSDVFTILPFRRDYGPNGAGSQMTNLVMGKFKILDYFAEQGIYMNSEGFNYEMLGRYIGAHNGYQAGFSRDTKRPPLAFFICHGLLAKKFWQPSDLGRFRGGDTEVPTPFSADNLYRWTMLLSFYGDKPMREFKVIPDGYYARYGDDVDVTWVKPEGVTVKLNGTMIADGQSVLLPKPRRGEAMWNILRAFSSTGETMRYPRPLNWGDIKNLTLMKLSFQNPPQVVPIGDKVRFDGDELVINIEAETPYKLVYGRELVAAEKSFEPLPPRPEITYPLETVVDRQGASKRPDWVALKTRKKMSLPEDITLCVGCSAVWPTKQEATEHAAAIISKKIAWFIRQNYVNRTRQYEQAFGANISKLGFENWYLGNDAAVKMFTLENINEKYSPRWYWEKVKAGPQRQTGWKAFVTIPFTAEMGHQVYLRAAKDRLEECRQQLQREDISEHGKERLRLNIKVYEKLLEEEPDKEPTPVNFQV